MKEFLKSVVRVALGTALCMLAIVIAADYHGSAREQPTITITTLLSGASATATTPGVLATGTMPQCRESAIYVQWTAGTTAGVVSIESAHDAAFTGTWAALTTATWATANKEDIIQITGIHGALRARVSTLVAGGSGVNVFAVCN